jgi:hypothetical protein
VRVLSGEGAEDLGGRTPGEDQCSDQGESHDACQQLEDWLFILV